MPSKRTTHKSSAGTKLYAVRDDKGRFRDIQTYKRAHGEDIKRVSGEEGESQVGETRDSVPDAEQEARQLRRVLTKAGLSVGVSNAAYAQVHGVTYEQFVTQRRKARKSGGH